MLIGIFLLWMQSAFSGVLGIDVFDARRGFESPSFYDSYTDAYGNLWVASEVGLFRYDGKHIRRFSKSDGFGNEILGIFPVHKDTIMVSSFDQGVTVVPVRNPSKRYQLVFPDSIALGSFVTTIVQFRDSLFIGTGDGEIYTKHKNIWTHHRVWPDNSLGNRIFSIYKHNNAIYSITSDGLFRLDSSGTNILVNDSRFISKATSNEKGDLFVAGDRFAYRIEGESVHPLFAYIEVGKRNVIGTVFPVNDSTLFVSYLGNGLSRMERKGNKWVETELLFDGEILTTIKESGPDHVIVGSKEQRFYRVPTKATRAEWVELQCNSQLSDNAFFVHKDDNKTIFVFRDNARIHTSLGNHCVRFELGEVEYAHLLDSNTLIVSSTYFTALLTLGRGKPNISYLREMFVRDEIRPPIKSIARFDEKHHAVATPNGVFLVDFSQKKVIRRVSGRATSVLVTNQQDIVIGTPTSLKQWNPIENTLKMLDSTGVSMLANLPNGSILVNSTKKGLLHYDTNSKTLREVPLPKGYTDVAWTRATPIGSDLGLIGTGKLFLARFQSEIPEIILYDTPVTQSPFVVRDAAYYADELLLATSLGIMRNLFPSFFSENEPHLRVSEAFINEHEQTPDFPLTIPADDRSVRLHFSHSYPFSNQPYRLEYRQGNSFSWVPLTGFEFIGTWENPGRERLYFRLVDDATEKEYEQIEIVLIFQPKWWETTVVRIAFLLLVVVGVGSLGAFVSQRQRQRQLMRLQNRMKYQELERISVTKLLTSHYLFNALTTIRQLAAVGDSGKVSRYISGFASLIRSLIERSSEITTNLQSELEWIENYVALESFHYEHPIRLDIIYTEAFDDECLPDEVHIPSFLLQPLIENAILYAPNENRTINIIVDYVNPDRFILHISNPANKNAYSGNSKSMGLELLRQRLNTWALVSGKMAVIDSRLQEEREGYLSWVVDIDLPLVMKA